MKGKTYKIVAAAGVLFAAAFVFVAASKDDFRLGRNMEIMFNIFREINLLYVDPVSPDSLMMDAADGMTMRLDPYTEYLPEEQAAEFEILTTGKYAGIGSLIRKKGDWVVISQPYKGFPADKAGLKIGDRIVEIGGKDAKGMDTPKVSSLLRGDPGTKIELKVEKFATGEVVPLTIRRERIVISGVPYHGLVEEGIGYIKHDDFSEDCANDLRKALSNLRKQGELKGLVIDLRGNGGGILQEAVKILSLFTPRGTEVVSMRGKVKEADATFRTESEPVDLKTPVVVLVNGNSASAAEIVSGAFQDLDRGVLLGQRTFGKGLVQTTRPTGYNTFLKITTAKYYIPSGRCIQAIDYTHRREDGSAGYVPDSLRKEFLTKGGRKVLDGGGVSPDVVTPTEHTSRFVIEAYVRGYIEDFVDDYLKKNPGLQVPLRTFALGDEAYQAFGAFMRGKDMKFESETQAALKQLRESATRERYMEKIYTALDQIERDLPDNLTENLVLYKDDFVRLIENEIVLRYHYMQGVVEFDMCHDKDVTAAVELLKDRARYDGLLAAPQ